MLKSRVRITSCFLWVMLSLLSFYSPNPAKAEVQYGVNVTVYNNYGYNASPPLPDVTGRPVVGTLVQDQILNNFDQQPLFNMYEDFIVKYEAHITAPCTCTIQLMAQADDGTKLYLNDVLITNDWRDKGGGGTVSAPVTFIEGTSQKLLMWFYENGGGAWTSLYWTVNGYWEIVPASAFTTEQVVTTTTEETTTTTSTTTTTVPETTTTVPVTTTTQQIETTTTIEPVRVVVTVPTATTVSPMPTTTYPPVIASTTTSQAPTTTELVTTTSSTSTVAPKPEIINEIANLPQSEIQAAVDNLINEGVSAEEATALATNPEIIKEVTAEQAAEIFDAVAVSELSDTQADQLIEAVQDAPQEVRAAFEDTINIFGGKFNKYVPIGSKINVGQRKVLVAASGVLFVAPTVSVSSSSSGSESSSRNRRK